MRILIAPDSFKESLSAADAAAALARGLHDVLGAAVTCRIVPVADGGEGTLAAVLTATDADARCILVRDPLGRARPARYALLAGGQRALVEMAEASGLTLVEPARRDPLAASSFGTGELIRDALAAGAQEVIVGLGGSATNDGGAGALQALGARFYDASGVAITAPLGGGDLPRIARLDLSSLHDVLATAQVVVACDVDNPLCGPRGASATFGPQKGASADTVGRLDAALAHFGELLEAASGRGVSTRPGAGAAGGLGAALLAACDARLVPGVDLVLDLIEFDAALDGVDLVVTGEGRVDGQTAAGKAPLGVARRSAARGIPVVAVGGSLGCEADRELADHFDAFETTVTAPTALEGALREARPNLEAAGRRIGRWLLLGRRLAKPPT
ncbi:MAG: glycerate kinase [Gammaproteobacteria bacterium]